MTEGARARSIAFHLPQFHPIPENDQWWGPGFTEWINTAKARPLFRGHVQPHLPADLGFYDLRLQDAREAQSRLAAAYGLAGFCYWHYWFGGGRRILERPVTEILASGEPHLGFCLGWANQTWTGIWHGADDRILVEQTYPGADDDQAHFDTLLPAFTDPRYLTVDGRPIFYVFRPEQLPDPTAWVQRWRSMADSSGLPGLYLVAELSDLLGGGVKHSGPGSGGFDAGVYTRLPAAATPREVLRMRVRRKLGSPERYRYSPDPVDHPLLHGPEKVFPAIYPNWDNSPRSGRGGLVLEGSSPEAFRPHARAAVNHAQRFDEPEQLVFVKSWNEWAEGNYLEPDLEHGHGFLQVLAEELGCPPPR